MAETFKWNTTPPIFTDGVITTGGMWEPQRRWWQSTSFIKAMVAGYGSGKTNISGKRAISVALENHGIPYLYISPSYKIAKRTIVPTIKALLDGRKINYRYHKTDHEFTFNYGEFKACIWIASGDDPESLKGPNVCAGNIDEPFIQSKEVFTQLLARVRDPNAVHREITLTGTPEQLNWGYDVCDGDETKNYDIELIQAATTSNKALPDQYVKTLLKAYDAKTAEAYVLGQFVNLNAGAVYHKFDIEENGTEKELSEDRTILVGMDFNVDPMSGILSNDIDGQLYTCDEIILPNSDTERLCKAIIERYPRGRFIVYPDSTGKSRSSKAVTDFEIIKEVLGRRLVKLEYPKKNPFVKDRFNSVNGMFCNTKGERNAFINAKRCPELVKDLQQVSFPYDEYKRKNKKRTHASDAYGYKIDRAYSFGKKPELRTF